MDNPLRVLPVLAPKLPSIIAEVTKSRLGYSATSTKWDWKTEAVVAVIRAMINVDKPTPILKTQVFQAGPTKIQGPMWIAKASMAAPSEDDLKVKLCAAIDAMRGRVGNGDEERYTPPEVKDVQGEWTGSRPNAWRTTTRPNVSEKEQYDLLMKDVTSDVTILYFHGGALIVMDPATHRVPVTKLCKLTGGRAFSVRYRLSPQSAFPEALLDCLLAYLSLLHPPPGAFHEVVPADKIVIAGDSAGGNLATALVQLILQMHRMENVDIDGQRVPTIRFHGADVPLHLPAGVALSSPWLDLTRCMPSMARNAKYDYLPGDMPDRAPHFPPDEAWPTTPARGDVYCELSMLLHPLVSPLQASSEQWKGAPPFWFGVGEECLLDEAVYTARKLAKVGVHVDWNMYEAMPHCFALVLPFNELAKGYMKKWAAFISGCVEGKVEGGNKGMWYGVKGEVKDVAVESMGELSDSQVRTLTEEARTLRVEGFGSEAVKGHTASRL